MSPVPWVLVVDDDETIRTLVACVFEDEGYRVRTAANGHDALQAMGARPPDLVLLDLQMPVMDGWAFARACRADPTYDGVPIVLMSAGHRVVEAQDLGAAAFVTKPFDLDVLLGTVATLV